MNDYLHLKPRKRSALRVFLGGKYYTYRRYYDWYIKGIRYATKSEKESLVYSVASHSTPLYRTLKDVDMWLQKNKVENLKIAIGRLNGVIIEPGETFSYWKLIGRPTYSKGYKDGMVLHYGKFKSGVGGGLCQLSNMIYWMMLHTPLTVTERYRHSFDVFPDSNRTQPFGSGATCVYNYRDLQIKNETNERYQLKFWIEDNQLMGEIQSDMEPYFNYKVYQSRHEITHEYWGEYIRHNEIRREVLDMNGHKINDVFVCENHALMMYEPFLKG